MKFAFPLLPFFFFCAVSTSALAQVFRCEEPKGVAMWSTEGHKVSPDGFSAVKPVVIIDDQEMTIVWGDAKSAGGAGKVWKTVVFYRSPEAVSGVALDAGPAGFASMLYTMNIKRGFLYMSVQKDGTLLNTAVISSYVSACSR